jgi:mannose/fructose-specific phosphotransferase system component IIA
VSAPLVGVVVAHGDLAEALVHAVEEVTGIQGALIAVSNRGCDRHSLEARILEAVDGRPGLVFVDLPTGSCFFAARHGLGRLPEARVVAGVNLSMLVDFVFHRDAGLAAAEERARAVGGQAIAGR